MVWLTVFHGDEQTFWRRMTPARLDRLYALWLGRTPSRRQPPAGEASLLKYLTEGGG